MLHILTNHNSYHATCIWQSNTKYENSRNVFGPFVAIHFNNEPLDLPYQDRLKAFSWNLINIFNTFKFQNRQSLTTVHEDLQVNAFLIISRV
jgi:hypothetical protein